MFDLKALAKDLNLSQVELSNILGVSQTAVSLVQNGKMDFPSAWEEILKQKLKVDISKYYLNKQIVSDIEPEYNSKGYMDKLIDNNHELIKNIEKLIDNNCRLVEVNELLSKKILDKV